jgi:hypothetical protein
MRAAAIGGLTLALVGSFGIAPAARAAPPDLPAEAPAPVEPAPPPAESSLPAWDQPLPIAPDVSFDGVPIEREEDEEPKTGHGRTVVGSLLLGGGVVLTTVSATFVALDTDEPVWIPGLVLGSGAVISGVIFIATGRARHRKYQEWARNEGPIPPRGHGLVAGGLTCIIAGSVGTIIGGISIASFQGSGDPPYGEVLVPLGVTSIVTGVGLLAVGGVRSKKYDRWKAGRLTPSVSLLPGARHDRIGAVGGLSLGFAGRF